MLSLIWLGNEHSAERLQLSVIIAVTEIQCNTQTLYHGDPN